MLWKCSFSLFILSNSSLDFYSERWSREDYEVYSREVMPPSYWLKLVSNLKLVNILSVFSFLLTSSRALMVRYFSEDSRFKKSLIMQFYSLTVWMIFHFYEPIRLQRSMWFSSNLTYSFIISWNFNNGWISTAQAILFGRKYYWNICEFSSCLAKWPQSSSRLP
jgi:hypothetical protein